LLLVWLFGEQWFEVQKGSCWGLFCRVWLGSQQQQHQHREGAESGLLACLAAGNKLCSRATSLVNVASKKMCGLMPGFDGFTLDDQI
jgi:hypothetical protein